MNSWSRSRDLCTGWSSRDCHLPPCQPPCGLEELREYVWYLNHGGHREHLQNNYRQIVDFLKQVLPTLEALGTAEHHALAARALDWLLTRWREAEAGDFDACADAFAEMDGAVIALERELSFDRRVGDALVAQFEVVEVGSDAWEAEVGRLSEALTRNTPTVAEDRKAAVTERCNTWFADLRRVGLALLAGQKGGAFPNGGDLCQGAYFIYGAEVRDSLMLVKPNGSWDMVVAEWSPRKGVGMTPILVASNPGAATVCSIKEVQEVAILLSDWNVAERIGKLFATPRTTFETTQLSMDVERGLGLLGRGKIKALIWNCCPAYSICATSDGVTLVQAPGKA